MLDLSLDGGYMFIWVAVLRILSWLDPEVNITSSNLKTVHMDKFGVPLCCEIYSTCFAIAVQFCNLYFSLLGSSCFTREARWVYVEGVCEKMGES